MKEKITQAQLIKNQPTKIMNAMQEFLEQDFQVQKVYLENIDEYKQMYLKDV